MELRVTTAVAILLLHPCLGAAQERLRLRFNPPSDVTVHTAFQTVTNVVTGDGDVIETADLGSMRAIALELEGGGTVLHLAYDSVLARIRSGGLEWREFDVPGADSVWIQARVDERLRVSATRFGAPLPAVTGLLDILTGIPDLTLPEQPVRVGSAWLVNSELPERVTELVPPHVGELPSLSFAAQITLDSAVQRAQDTLGYFTVSGYIEPTSAADFRALAAEGLAVSSDINAQLVWSSGWSRFVSGANRVTMEISRSRLSTTPIIEQSQPVLTMHVTTRYQVRP